MSMHQTIEQRRAQAAWTFAQTAQEKFKKKDEFKGYVNLVKNISAMIMTNGLGQALAFLVAKAKIESNKKTQAKWVNQNNMHGLLYTQLENWLIKADSPDDPYHAPYSTPPKNKDETKEPTRLLFRLIHHDSTTYRRATLETLAFCTWLKSFADALQEKEETQDTQSEGSQSENA